MSYLYKVDSSVSLKDLLTGVISTGRPFRFKAKGFSMSPFIRDEDILTVAPLGQVGLDTGKIAAFIHPLNNNLVVHRVVGKAKGGYLLKGDNVYCCDGLVSIEKIIGYLVRVERKSKDRYFGLGPERRLIAFLSRAKILHLMFFTWRLLVPFKLRSYIKCKMAF